MMRSVATVRAASAITLLVAGAGCPKAPTRAASVPTVVKASDDARTPKLARILRAADRRIVDEDLRALLSDPDETVRAKAVLAVGQIGEAGSRPDLERATHDATAVVRARAAFALGLLAEADPAAIAPLAADASPEVRAAAIEALGRIHRDTSLPAVQAALDDPDATVRVAAALAAWKFADPETLMEGLIAALGAPDARVRAAAAYALARLASAPAAPPSSGAPVGRLSASDVTRARTALAARVGDGEPEVRMQIARGLASPRDAGETAVVGALSGDRDPRVRVSAVRSLGYPGIPIKPYLDRAATDRDLTVARTAIESIGKVGGGTAIEKLNTLLPNLTGTWLLAPAFEALTRLDPAMAPEVVEGLLANPDPVMRAAAAPMIVGHKESKAIRASLALLADPDPRVQAAAVPLVADQEGPIGKLLERRFAAPDPVVRAAVAEAVGVRFETPHPAVESRDDLFARLDELAQHASTDTLPDAKIAILDAASKAGADQRTRAALERGLKDPDVVVRRRAAQRFQEVFGEDRSGEVGPAADRPLEDYEKIVRWSRTPHTAVITMQRPGTFPGSFTVVLDPEAAPMAAWNFAELAGKKFFDGAVLHRVVPNFVVQDGDPRGDGFGGPGYSIRDEFNPLPFSAGTLGMASDGKDTAGSQWFITHSAQPHLDGRYTSFGRVTQGLREIVSQILAGDTVVSIRVDGGS
ncbi:MAG TPA: HEAT repeat domain-containing protein [Candidatus Polarisedimenticolaceae bacterium]|nr:HEAT repeat domain-containing protein [Candidatus Polarisedimenticolaceae bacterium]